MQKLLSFLSIFSFLLAPHLSLAQSPYGKTGKAAILRNAPKLEFYLADKGVKLGNAVFLRILKDKSQMQLWMKAKNGKYKFIRNYKICGAQTQKIPMGIYFIKGNALSQKSPNSIYIPSNYPNDFDKAQKPYKAMGISGKCNNAPFIGITDTDLDELFTIMAYGMKNGQTTISLHIFPQELGGLKLLTMRGRKDYKTLEQLSKIYSYFESKKQIPNIIINKFGYALAQ